MSHSHRVSAGARSRLLAMVFAAALALALVPLGGAGAQVDDDNDRSIDGEVEREEADGERAASTRFAGRERFSTAGLIAVDTYEENSTAVVARHNEFADALAGGYLAGQLGAPILLISPNDLQEPTLAAMDDLGVDEVVLLGGTEAISAENASRLETEEDKTVSRIFGETRYETARDIALREGNVVGQHNEMNTAILATGIVFADALSSGPLASGASFPLLLTPSQSLHPAAVEALEELEIEQVLIMGQGNAVSAGVEAEVEAMEIETIRLGGTTRVETADAIARFAIDELGFSAEGHGWARGNEFADALTIGPRLGLAQSPVLLTVTENRWDSGEGTNAEFAAEFDCFANRIDLAGGTAAISEEVAEQIRQAFACIGVTLLHDTHFHGDFGPEDGPNIARYMTLVEGLKMLEPDALFLGNGDDLAPSVMAGIFHGEHMIEALNASPLDVNTFGNHEFDFGPDNLRERIEQSDFPWVTANVRDIDSGEPFAADLGVERFLIWDVHGVNVGITGLGPERMAEVTSLGDDTEQIPAIDAMEEVVPEMQAAGADLIVVTSHLCGPDARELAEEVDGIDAIVGDHCAEVLEEPEVINDTIVSFVGDEFDFLGELRLHVQEGELFEFAFTLHELTADIEPHPEIQAIVDDWEAQLDEALNEVIGFREAEWNVESPDPVRRRETPFANYITDAMLDEVGAEVALQNGGGIRSDTTYPGDEDIILRDVVSILPFPNTVVMVEITGANIRAALENGVSRVEDGDGRFPHVAGMSYVWDPDADPGNRIVNVEVGGLPLVDAQDYTLATNDFLLGGGDGYDMLFEGDDRVIIAPEEGRLLSEVVADQIRADGTVNVTAEGRIEEVP